jgi:hypothetical protein
VWKNPICYSEKSCEFEVRAEDRPRNEHPVLALEESEAQRGEEIQSVQGWGLKLVSWHFVLHSLCLPRLGPIRPDLLL